MKINLRHLAVTFFGSSFLTLLSGCVTQQVETRAVTERTVMKYEEAVHVETEPTGAKIYFKDEYIGVSPCDLTLKAGKVAVSATGTVNYHVAVDGMNGQRFESLDNTSWRKGGSLQPSAPGGSWRIQASKAGYESAVRQIQIAADDDNLNTAFQTEDAINKFNAAILNKLSHDAVRSSQQQLRTQAGIGGLGAYGGMVAAQMPQPTDDQINGMNGADDSSLPVVRGQHSVLLTLSPAAAGQQQQQQQQQTVVIPGGGDSNASKRGAILVSSEPANAEVYADGIFVGNAPANLKLDDGIHIIEVKLDGYKPYHREMRVLSDSTLNLKAQLEKTP